MNYVCLNIYISLFKYVCTYILITVFTVEVQHSQPVVIIQCTIIVIQTNVEKPNDFEAEQRDRFNAMNVWQT